MKFAASLLAALLLSPALAAPGAGDLERATTRAAGVVDGVLRNCPAGFARIGTPEKRCVGASGTVEQVRTRLGAALEADLYGVWRSRDGQRSVYNWLRTPGGYVYLRVQPDPEGRAQTLLYLDTPPQSGEAQAGPAQTGPTPSGQRPSGSGQAAAAGVTVTRPAPARTAPITPTPATPAPVTPTTGPEVGTAAPAPRGLAPVPFRRTLQVQGERLNGADVAAVQNRLIALTRPSGGGRGDGWYGPVTAATVRAFQAANGLPVTGRVDRSTWTLLFSSGARPFPASAIRIP